MKAASTVNRWAPTALLAALVLAGGCGEDEPGAPGCVRVPGDHQVLAEAPCPAAVPDDPQLSCGTLELAEDPDTDRSCRLSIAWVRYEPDEPSTEPPVFVLGGGPAQAMVELSTSVLGTAHSLAPERTWVWHDPRGVGESNLRLDCSQPQPLAGADRPSQLGACAAAYKRAGHDPTRFRTEALAADVDALARAFDAERIDVFGASYGSRLGYALASMYPERVRALVLDAAVPLDAPLYERPVQRYMRAMGRVAEACASSDHCTAEHGDVAEIHAANIERLATRPFQFQVDGLTLDLNAGTYLALSAALAAGRGANQVPAFVTAAANGDREQVQAAFLGISSSTVDPWVHHAIMCSEELPQNDRDRARQDLAKLPEFASALPYDAVVEQCEALDMAPAPDAPPAWHGRVGVLAEDLPVLALCGAYDPLSAAENWVGTSLPVPEGSLHVMPNASHAARASRCGTALIRQFLASPGNDLQLPQAECTPDPRFFVSRIPVP